MRFVPFVSVFAILATMSVAAMAAPGSAGHSHAGETAFGAPGDPKKPARVVQIAMKETSDGKMVFTPERLTVKRGEQIRFRIRNAGEIDHEMVIGTLEENLKHGKEMAKHPDMEHDDPNGKRLAPKQSGEILWRFSKAGEFDFSCLIPGHRESGMTGTVVVK